MDLLNKRKRQNPDLPSIIVVLIALAILSLPFDNLIIASNHHFRPGERISPAQPSQAPAAGQNEQARQMMEQALQKLRGRESLHAIASLTIKAKGF